MIRTTRPTMRSCGMKPVKRLSRALSRLSPKHVVTRRDLLIVIARAAPEVSDTSTPMESRRAHTRTSETETLRRAAQPGMPPEPASGNTTGAAQRTSLHERCDTREPIPRTRIAPSSSSTPPIEAAKYAIAYHARCTYSRPSPPPKNPSSAAIHGVGRQAVGLPSPTFVLMLARLHFRSRRLDHAHHRRERARV